VFPSYEATGFFFPLNTLSRAYSRFVEGAEENLGGALAETGRRLQNFPAVADQGDLLPGLPKREQRKARRPALQIPPPRGSPLVTRGTSVLRGSECVERQAWAIFSKHLGRLSR
jgi:hypothetical protein